MPYIATYLPWLLSAITIWMTLLAGNKHPQAWLVGLVNQGLWLFWICVTGSWGFLPMNLALWIVYGRNHLKWQRERPKFDAERCETPEQAQEAMAVCHYWNGEKSLSTKPSAPGASTPAQRPPE
jgi:hypothetical protein